MIAHPFEARIRANRLLDLGVEWQDELIFPDFSGLSIYNLAQTILAVFGAPTVAPLDDKVWGQNPPYGHIDRVLLVISDGLGYKLLSKVSDEDSEVRELIAEISDERGFLPLTSVAPSTTACALPTFWTARTPAETGMIGTALWLREFGAMGDLLRYAPVYSPNGGMEFERWGIKADAFIPVPSITQQLAQVNIPTHLLLDYRLFGTGLSRLMHRGVIQQHLHVGGADIWMRLSEVLTQTVGQRCFISAYIPNIDSLSHAYGYDTPYIRQEIRQQLTGIRDALANGQDGRTLVLIVADHGHYDAPHLLLYDVEPSLSGLLAASRSAFSGDDRFRYLHLRDEVSVKSDQFVLVDTKQAIQAGIFGSGDCHPDLLNRAGDKIAIVRPGVRLTDQNFQFQAVSIHSGLSEWEMLVPLLWNCI